MIVVLAKGKTKKAIASPKAKGWVGPGDERWPCEELKSEPAFITRWKQLNKQGYKDTEYLTSKPKKSAKQEMYFVKATTKDPLFKAFAAWSKKQPYGSFGYFEVITGALPKKLTSDAELTKSGRSLLHLPDGSIVAASAAGPIFFLDSEGGKPKRIGDDVRGFLTKLSKGKTGVNDLDDKDATGRKALVEWLATQR